MESIELKFDPKVVVGLDVSKRHLDVVIHGRRSFRRFDNSSVGIDELIIWLTKKEGSVPSRGVIHARRLGCDHGFIGPRRAD